MYGNYCGPYWSDGKWQSSVTPGKAPVDDLDETCMEHDEVYARGGDLLKADRDFFNANFGASFLSTLFAIPVGIQSVLRASEILGNNQPYQEFDNKNTMTQKKPSATPKSTKQGGTPTMTRAKAPKRAASGGGMAISSSTPPVSYGTTIRATLPKVTRSMDNAHMTGRDFIGTVEGNGLTTFGLGKSALLSPAYFASTVLGNLARSFEKYRWNRLRIHYVPKVATTVTGQVVMCSQHSVSEPGLTPEAGTFLPRAMSQGNAAFGPLWAPLFIDIDCDPEYKNVDPATTADIDDCIHEELQVYTQVNAVQQVGYLFAEYDISFKEPVYQPHSTLMPIVTGPGQRILAVDGASAVNDDWVLSTTLFGQLPIGTIIRAVFDIQGSRAGTGATFANLLLTAVSFRNTVTTTQSVTTALPLVGGATFYLVCQSGSTANVYTSLTAAINGNGSGEVYINTLTTADGAYNFDAQIVRYGVAQLPVIQ